VTIQENHSQRNKKWLLFLWYLKLDLEHFSNPEYPILAFWYIGAIRQSNRAIQRCIAGARYFFRGLGPPFLAVRAFKSQPLQQAFSKSNNSLSERKVWRPFAADLGFEKYYQNREKPD
jgi:hypothetical protein